MSDPTSSDPAPEAAEPKQTTEAKEISEPTPSEQGGDSAAGPRWSRWLRSIGLVVGLLGAFLLGTAVVGGPEGEGGVASGEHTDHDAAPAAEVWTCSMHPQIRMEQPGQCPICGMDLIPARVDDGADHVDLKNRVSLSPRASALAQLRVTKVARTQPRAEIRLLGRVDYDETRLRTVTPWTAGRIDRLKVRVTGERVRRGQVVAQLYSPEVYAAMRDLVLAIKQAERLSGGLHGSSTMAKNAVESSRERLRLLGVPAKAIANVEKTRDPPTHVDVRSPFGGTVLERKVEQGSYVNAGTPLFSVADLSRVWVQIDAYESDLPYLRVDQEVLVQVESLPDEPLAGKITFIDPVVDKKQRTARVRVEVDNEDGRLRPGMFAEAIVQGDVGRAHMSELTVPDAAVLFTGRRSVVYVQVPDQDRPTYELRSVRLGPRAGGVYPVVSGLSEGELVVSHGAFLLDADLQLSGGRSMMTMADDVDRAPTQALVVPAEFRAALRPVVEHYLEVQGHLAGDDFAAAREALGKMATAVNEADPPGSKRAREVWQELASALSGHAKHGAMAKEDGQVRVAFEQVSAQIQRLLRQFGNPVDEALRVAFCPMAFDSKGAEWVQREDQVSNPYYGTGMLRCGEFRATLLPGEALATSSGEEKAPPAGAMAGHQH